MKKITLNDTDLDKIVNKVLNEQKNIQFDEDELELIHFIFERELKPPFRKEGYLGLNYTYYNRDGEKIGWLDSRNKKFELLNPFWSNIRYKVCQAFQFPYDTFAWWLAVKPHLKPWLEDKLNIILNVVE